VSKRREVLVGAVARLPQDKNPESPVDPRTRRRVVIAPLIGGRPVSRNRVRSVTPAAILFVPCLRDSDDKIGDQRPQFYYRRNLHEQCNIALHLKVIDSESDAQEQHESCRRFFNFEYAFPISGTKRNLFRNDWATPTLRTVSSNITGVVIWVAPRIK
jgi:hypothetical protein